MRRSPLRFLVGLFAALGAAAILVGCGTTETVRVTERVTVTETRTVIAGPDYALCRQRAGLFLESYRINGPLARETQDYQEDRYFYCTNFADMDRALREAGETRTRKLNLCEPSEPADVKSSPVCRNWRADGNGGTGSSAAGPGEESLSDAIDRCNKATDFGACMEAWRKS